jgi:hypothetical protein
MMYQCSNLHRNDVTYITGHTPLPRKGVMTTLLPHQGQRKSQGHQNSLKKMTGIRRGDPILLMTEMIAVVQTTVMMSKFCSLTVGACLWINLVMF